MKAAEARTIQAELRAVASRLFAPALSRYGFEMLPTGFCFYRKAGEIHQFVMVRLRRDGHCVVDLLPTVPEIDDQIDFSNVQKSYKGMVSDLTRRCLGHQKLDLISGKSWPMVPVESEASASMDDILISFEKQALPWLDQITTRKALADNVAPSEEHTFDGKVKEIILGQLPNPKAAQQGVEGSTSSPSARPRP